MLTICTRCRTPYDRRLAPAGGASHLVAFCAGCATGTARDTDAALVVLPVLPVEVTVLPRTVLPVAS